MIFRRHPRWPPKRLALPLLPYYPRNPSNPRLPSVLACRRLLNSKQRTRCLKLNNPMSRVHPEHSEGSLYFQRLTRCLKFATLSEPLCFQSLPTIKLSKPFVLITMPIAGGWGVPLGGVRVKAILELRQAERPGIPRPTSPLESTLTSPPA